MLNGFTQACKLTPKTGRYIKQPMAQQQFITSTSQIELRALAWQGIQASTCYEQLVYILQTKLSPSHAALLAQPVMDTSNPKYGEKEVDWYWKVRNVGSEAIKRGQERGGIVHGGRTHHESTSFSGDHYVECFAVYNNIVIAKGKVRVPIDTYFGTD